jgi:hypothetical protein
VITDLDGDGHNGFTPLLSSPRTFDDAVLCSIEVILVTREPRIKVLAYNPLASSSSAATTSMGDNNNNNNKNNENEVLKVHHDADLLGSVAIVSGRQAVALATGYLQPYSTTKARQQVIVVVTEGWHVLCYDSKLKLLWERTVEADLGGRYLGEVAIAITSQQMLINDTGAVLVGGRLHARSDLVQHTIHNVIKDSTPMSSVQGGGGGGGEGGHRAEFDFRQDATTVANQGEASPDDDDDDKAADMTTNDESEMTKVSRLARKLTIPSSDIPNSVPTIPTRRLLHAGPVDEEDPDHEGNPHNKHISL